MSTANKKTNNNQTKNMVKVPNQKKTIEKEKMKDEK